MIPTPPPGYWAKKAHGKIVRRASLPPCDDPAMATVTIGGCSVAGNSPAAAEKPPVVSTFFDPELGRLAEAEARGDDPIVVAESLRSPHPLVARTREGLTAAYKSKYRRELVVYPSPVSDLCCLDLRVGQDNFSRALRVIDALIKGLEIRGYEVSVPIQQWKPGTLVKALGVRFQIKLREPTMHQAHEPTAVERESIKKYPNTNSVPKWDHVPSNQLVLELQTGSGWTICTVRDGKKRRIEDNLLEIPLAILRHADDDKRKAVAAAKEARKRAELDRQRRDEEERRRLAEQRRKEEQARVDELFAQAARWDRCRQTREYLEAVRTLASERCGEIEPDSNLDRWLRWAEDAANRVDPLIAVQKEIDALPAARGEAECEAGAVNKPR